MKSFVEHIEEAAIKLSSNYDNYEGGSTDDFVKKVKRMGRPHPFKDGVIIDLGDAEVYVEMIPYMTKAHLTEIAVLHGDAGEGYGGKVMKKITDLADKMKITISLNPSPFEQSGVKISKSSLVRFYKKFGFKTMKNGTMER